MSSTWNGSILLNRFAKKHGFGTNDSTVNDRVLEWINEIQADICESYDWPFLKFKMKKQFSLGDHEVDLSPQVPSAPTVALASGGGLTLGASYQIKTTFVIYDESLKEFNSLESEPSTATTAIVTTAGNLTLNLTNVSIYADAVNVKPLNIQRRIYLSLNGGNFYLYSTLADNTTTTATIILDTATTNLIEPPEYSLVASLADEDPIIESKGATLSQAKLGDLLAYSSNLAQKGLPCYYARISPKKILLYPKPSSTITISYWVYRIPSRIFNDVNRAVQLDHSFKTLLDSGVTWKGYEYKDESGVEQKLQNYLMLKSDAKGKYSRMNGQVNTVKEVC